MDRGLVERGWLNLQTGQVLGVKRRQSPERAIREALYPQATSREALARALAEHWVSFACKHDPWRDLRTRDMIQLALTVGDSADVEPAIQHFMSRASSRYGLALVRLDGYGLSHAVWRDGALNLYDRKEDYLAGLDALRATIRLRTAQQ